jgi:hypothetical protein
MSSLDARYIQHLRQRLRQQLRQHVRQQVRQHVRQQVRQFRKEIARLYLLSTGKKTPEIFLEELENLWFERLLRWFQSVFARLLSACKYFEYPNRRRPPCTTMPWNIWPSLVVLWGVCWMFYTPLSSAEWDGVQAGFNSDEFMTNQFGEWKEFTSSFSWELTILCAGWLTSNDYLASNTIRLPDPSTNIFNFEIDMPLAENFNEVIPETRFADDSPFALLTMEDQETDQNPHVTKVAGASFNCVQQGCETLTFRRRCDLK